MCVCESVDLCEYIIYNERQEHTILHVTRNRNIAVYKQIHTYFTDFFVFSMFKKYFFFFFSLFAIVIIGIILVMQLK